MDRFTERLGYIKQVNEEWWKLLYTQCAASLIFYRGGTHAEVQDSAQINAIILLLTITKTGKGKYKICRVTRTFPNKDENVRLVEMEMRLTSNKETALP